MKNSSDSEVKRDDTKLEKEKKAYHSPRLVNYGDVSRITRGGTKVQTEGGVNDGSTTRV